MTTSTLLMSKMFPIIQTYLSLKILSSKSMIRSMLAISLMPVVSTALMAKLLSLINV